MNVHVIVESPCDQHLHDQEYDDCGDVILYWQDILPVLHIQETPESPNHSIYNRQTSVKWQLRDLGCWQFAVRILKGDNSIILYVSRGKCIGPNAVVPGLFDGIVDRLYCFKIYGSVVDAPC